jgi:hypothetical protein
MRSKLLTGDGGNQARSPGRARRNPLKPLRGEGRMIRLNLWFLTPVLSSLHRRPRAQSAPGFPRSLLRVALRPLSKGDKRSVKPRAKHVARWRNYVCVPHAFSSSFRGALLRELRCAIAHLTIHNPCVVVRHGTLSQGAWIPGPKMRVLRCAIAHRGMTALMLAFLVIARRAAKQSSFAAMDCFACARNDGMSLNRE